MGRDVSVTRRSFTYAFGFFFAVFTALSLTAQTQRAEASVEQPLPLVAVAPLGPCSSLMSADLSRSVGASTIIPSAAEVTDGKTAPFCKVQIVLDHYAKVELHLPLTTWTQRMLFGGGPSAEVRRAMKLDYFATASWQDLGHRGHEDDFATNYQYRIDAGYREMHLQVLAAKAVIAKFYGQAPRFSYFDACSEPSLEAMIEIQRFPEDFDGVGAGCPPLEHTLNNGLFEAWNVLTNTGADGQPILTADKLPILHQAILDQCDAADGLKDGIVSDPLSCHPDLRMVACKPRQDPATCLTSQQVHAAEEIYRGAHDEQGRKLAPMGVLPGSELAWTATIVPDRRNPMGARNETTTAIRSEFSDPPLPGTWNLNDLRFDRATFEATTKLRYLYDATDPDLALFAKGGRKLILWQGLGDTNVLPAYSILYYSALQRQMGSKAVEQFARLYLLPGVYHCGGGDGPVLRDVLGPLMLWVERGIAPGALSGAYVPTPAGATNGFMEASRDAGPVQAKAGAVTAPDLTRPIYPYPYLARYVGTGSANDAANFVQGVARPAPAAMFDWLGTNFYTPHNERWCSVIDEVFRCGDSR